MAGPKGGAGKRRPLKEVQGNVQSKGVTSKRKKIEAKVPEQACSGIEGADKKPHVLESLFQQTLGGRGGQSRLQRAAVQPVIENVSQFCVSRLTNPFDRRVTALAWSPKQPYLAAAGSKGGDILLWDTRAATSGDKECFLGRIKGRGPGGSIQSLLFDELEGNRVFTASIDGRVARRDFSGREDKLYLTTNDWEKWYVGMDVCFSGRTLVAGNNAGHVTLLSLEGEQIWTHRLHKSKCNFVQFSKRQPWMMVTTSTSNGTGKGGVAKVWDIRKISGPESALAELQHDKAVNSAYFSPIGGDKLLTTDQHSQLRVYQAPTFNHICTISHPHRQFQHLTPIKAVWHPLADVVVAGRYPDPDFPGHTEGEARTIDFFCAASGREMLRLHQLGLDKIISLSQFNPIGDRLLSGMGGSLLLWQAKTINSREVQEVNETETSATVASNLEDLDVEHWPEFGKKKKVKGKKVKEKEST